MTTLYITGDKIGQYGHATFTGNGALAALTLTGVRPLGTKNDIFRIEVRQTNGATAFGNGQFVDVYDEDGKLLFSNMNPKHDEYQGRAGSTTHQLFSDQRVIIDIHGVGFGIEGYNLLNDDKGRLPFKCLQQAPCFLEGTLIQAIAGDVPVEYLKAGDMLMSDRMETFEPYPVVRHITSHLVSEPLYEINGLIVTGQHRILFTNDKGETGLIRAKHHPAAVERVYDKPQRVYSVFTDRQCVLMANGVWAASSKPGPELLKLVGPAEEAKLTEVLGDLAAYCADAPYPDMNKRGEIKE